MDTWQGWQDKMQLPLFRRKKDSKIDELIEPFDKRMAKVEREVNRHHLLSGVPRWKVRELYEQYGYIPSGNEPWDW